MQSRKNNFKNLYLNIVFLAFVSNIYPCSKVDTLNATFLYEYSNSLTSYDDAILRYSSFIVYSDTNNIYNNYTSGIFEYRPLYSISQTLGKYNIEQSRLEEIKMRKLYSSIFFNFFDNLKTKIVSNKFEYKLFKIKLTYIKIDENFKTWIFNGNKYDSKIIPRFLIFDILNIEVLE